MGGAHIGQRGRQREGQLLRFRAACRVHGPAVPDREGTFEALRDHLADEACEHVRHVGPDHVVPAIGRQHADGIESEADIDVARSEAALLHEIGEHQGGVLAERAKLKLDGHAPFEVHVLQRLFENGLGRRQGMSVIAGRALEHEAEAAGAVVQVFEDLPVSRPAVSDVDALDDLPRRPRRPAGNDVRIARPAIERLDDDAVIALGFERGEGRALQRLFHQRLPGRFVGGRKVAGQGEFSHLANPRMVLAFSPSTKPARRETRGILAGLRP